MEVVCVDLKEITINALGTDSYQKGKYYESNLIRPLGNRRLQDDIILWNFSVQSTRYYMYYRINIFTEFDKILKYSCNCPQFERAHTCKHIAACILEYGDQMLKEKPSEFDVSKEILELFYNDNGIKNNIKEELKLDITFDFDRSNISFSIGVGVKKTYIIKNESKFNDFMDSYRDNETYTFGVNFTYDPNKHFFNKQDSAIIGFINEYKKDDNYYSYYYNRRDMFDLSNREFKYFLNLLKNKPFTIKGYGLIYDVIEDIPTNLKLDYIEDYYTLKIEDLKEYNILDSECKYIVYNNTLYLIPPRYSKLIIALLNSHVEELKFKKDNMELFKNGLLKDVKNNIDIDEKVTDIVVSGKPVASLYFDLLKDKITCKIKLDYKGIELDYFDDNERILRDESYEDEIINDLISNKFEIDKKNITMSDIDDIGYFISEGIINLKEKYDIYTTKKIDNMNIIKKSKIESNFSIGKDNIMSYKFSTDNIDMTELNKVLSSLKNKKRYYKLKNGSLIDLEENEELKELNNIFDDLDLTSKDIEEGNIEIPKYRAFYIDSLKKNKYKSISTNNSFDTFINNFKKYKNTSISLNKRDEEILRDYQKDGVKWLYTLYKCDLGGILADEMGLGKSIQTIMFIKQVLKEKPDSKIIIVCPTSLVYNWVKEFEKFGSELKYVAVAENKEKRKEIIKNQDNYNIFITSYGLVRNDNDEYEKMNFEVCIIDEAQAIKNYQAGMTKEIKKIKARTKIALTGTPLENSVTELWSIFDFIMPGYLNSIIKFKENYGIKEVDEKSLEKLTNLNYQIKPFILRRKKQEVYKDLPEKIENNIYLELPDLQKALYVKVLKETEEEMNELIACEGFQKARFKILQLLMKLRQICVDPNILFENYKGDSVKIEKLVDVVKDMVADGHKILIFSSFKRVIDRVKNIFEKENISSYVITGGVKGKDRMRLVEDFNKDGTNCFLITLKSGGTGLNLTSADVVIHLDIWWNPQVENQATDRTHRIGQKNKVTVIKLVTKGTIEEKIIELQDKKKILSDNLIEGKNDSELLSSLEEKDIKKLLSYGSDEE